MVVIPAFLLPQLNNIFRFLEVVSRETVGESVSKNCVGLIGDLAVAFVHHTAEVANLCSDTTFCRFATHM